MALSLTQVRNQILTSIFGRRLGLDVNDYLIGAKDTRRQTVVVTSANSTGTTLDNHGIIGIGLTTLATSTASSAGSTEVGSVFAIGQPVEGARLTLYATTPQSTNTTCIAFAPATVIWTSLGSTFTVLRFTAPGQTAELQGVSSSKWMVLAAAGGTSFQSSN